MTNVLREDYLGLNGWGFTSTSTTPAWTTNTRLLAAGEGAGAGSTRRHGTFVAGVIVGDGSSTYRQPAGVLSRIPTSRACTTAPHVLKADDDKVNNPVSDDWLQTEAATANYDRKTSVNVLISNNSWEYEDQNDYTAAASYDAATRDALPERATSRDLRVSGRQLRAGTDNGLNASPGTISAPGTAKNVITVGAIESGQHRG